MRTECLDHLLILGRRHAQNVLRIYVSHYNEKRPHRGLDLVLPDRPHVGAFTDGSLLDIERRDILGGLIHEYHPTAA